MGISKDSCNEAKQAINEWNCKEYIIIRNSLCTCVGFRWTN